MRNRFCYDNAIFHGSLNSIFQVKICDIFLICGPNGSE